MLVNSLLRAAGYSREAFDQALATFRSELLAFRNRAIDSESRLISLEDKAHEMACALQRIEAALQKPNSSASVLKLVPFTDEPPSDITQKGK